MGVSFFGLGSPQPLGGHILCLEGGVPNERLGPSLGRQANNPMYAHYMLKHNNKLQSKSLYSVKYNYLSDQSPVRIKSSALCALTPEMICVFDCYSESFPKKKEYLQSTLMKTILTLHLLRSLISSFPERLAPPFPLV